MSNRPGGLGRGLGALIPAATESTSGLVSLPRSSVVPNRRQPRLAFDQAALAELAHSLKEVGLLQPVIVRPLPDGRYELVAGERRFRAAGLAGMDTISAIVRRTEDSELLTEALVENIHRTDLNAIEEAAAYQQLLDDFGFTHQALADRLGRSRSSISNSLRLLTLPPELQQRVADGSLTAGHARALLSVEDVEERDRLARRVLAEGLSVRATEDAARRTGKHTAAAGPDHRRSGAYNPGPYSGLQRRLSDALATSVAIKGTTTRGRLVIDYSGREDLSRILAILSSGTGEDLVSES